MGSRRKSRLLPSARSHGRRQGCDCQRLFAMAVVRRWLKARDREEHHSQGDQRSDSRQRLDRDRRRTGQGEQGDDLRKLLRCEEDKDISLLIKATKPGVYAIEKAPPEGAEQGSGEGSPAGEPEAGAASESKAPAKGEAPGVED